MTHGTVYNSTPMHIKIFLNKLSDFFVFVLKDMTIERGHLGTNDLRESGRKIREGMG